MLWLIGFIVVIFAASAIHGWFSEKSRLLKEDEYNCTLRQQLFDQKQNLESEMAKRSRSQQQQLEDRMQKLKSEKAKFTQQLEKRAEFVAGLRREFDAGYMQGRKWLAAFLAEADRALDDSISLNLRNKSHPAPKASD